MWEMTCQRDGFSVLKMWTTPNFGCQVNGRSLVGVTHHEAVDVLKEAGNDVTVVVARLTQKHKQVLMVTVKFLK